MNEAAQALIKDVEDVFGEKVANTLEACEVFYMNGLADEICGDVDGGGHYYRVDRWIVRTDSQGFHYLDPYPTVQMAERAFSIIARECDEEEG